ncbi:DUF4479 and tRNA-binding domain-containing protein [Ligilactobacillus sp. WILCCON 0076]|uniref:DUF4479 and tRNA-binding domain-containing protein n=1 Tax=Ligilactobacillus ubinensis TaxID=2876789 RepID=A0A9X2FJ19_9LACO|nr:DUF4479 and tRNA-binding domain-containing protein [Ligilactobacillus ubinensis]MCP0886744.1 DUF4479 and tRNA-binding domain-containing protein [Ligilactobacillus ubinensis]
MLVSSYNPTQIGDVLIVLTNPDVVNQRSETKQDVVRIFDSETHETIGFNFFDVSKKISDVTGLGQIQLNSQQVDKLNFYLKEIGFAPELKLDVQPKFVVGNVIELAEHPDSDHLHVAKVQVDEGEVLQIVCGAPNIEKDQNVVVAKVGAMMPNGMMIWPGALRGVSSYGMICAARELNLPNAPQKRGILVLNKDEYPAGQSFDFAKAAYLFNN